MAVVEWEAFPMAERLAELAAQGAGLGLLRLLSDRCASTASSEDVKGLAVKASLAQAAYDTEASQGELEVDGRHFLVRARSSGGDTATFFLAQEAAGSGSLTGKYYLVFRGTAEVSDVVADGRVQPMHFDGLHVHTGFALHLAPEGNPGLFEVAEILRDHDGQVELEILGHSLGGALAVILAAGGWFQRILRREALMRVTMFGSPKAFHGTPAHIPNVTLVVNDGDLVPRLLGGSDMHVLPALLRREGLEDQSGIPGTLLRLHQDIHDVCAGYSHPPGTRLVILRKGLALTPRKAFNDLWLCMGAVVCAVAARQRNPVADHSLRSYLQALEQVPLSTTGRRGVLQDLEVPEESLETLRHIPRLLHGMASVAAGVARRRSGWASSE